MTGVTYTAMSGMGDAVTSEEASSLHARGGSALGVTCDYMTKGFSIGVHEHFAMC